jgi:2-polyprenyl-3-methyl-5-hydroxy-6-metoxy-1,4-benzoquinol methylase
MDPNYDSQRAEAFGGQMLEILNHGALALMVSIGHRTGLFDVMATQGAETSDAIAQRSGLDERYVREWLGALVTGGIVEYEPETRCYRLPPEHASVLTRAARPENMAATAQWIGVLGAVESEIVRCFAVGGGVPYEKYERFHAVMAEESDQTVVAVLLDAILPAAPGLVARLEAGIDVLDVGCGSGRALIEMARAYPRSRFVGFDLSEEAVTAGRENARESELSNLRFEAKDVSTLGDSDRFDLVTAFDAIHDQAHPDVVLAGISGALRPDGVFLMQDIGGSSHVHEDRDHPAAPFLYTISCMHCMTVSLAQGGAGLGAMWGEELACRMLAEAGFGDVEVKTLPHDVMNKYFLARKSPARVGGAAWL